MSSGETSKTPPRRGLHVALLVVVANASALAGFFLIYKPASNGTRVSTLAISDAATPARVDAGDASPAVDEALRENELARYVKTAPSVSMDEPFYWRCWAGMEEDEPSRPEKECKRLKSFERLVASRMREIIECYERLDGPAVGTLSLAVDVTFPRGTPDAGTTDEGTVRFWSGQSSNIKGADVIVACLRDKVKSLPLKGIRHKWLRYSIFFPIEFKSAAPEGSSEMVELLLDRVRLRERPVDGKIVARLRRGEPLEVLERGEGWIRVKTVDGRVGWVYSPAITMEEE